MTSNDPPESEASPQRLKSEDLDMIANFMDNILNNMKSHIQNIEKNKNLFNDSFPIQSGSQNSLNAVQNEIPVDQTPVKSEVPNPPENPSEPSNSPKPIEVKKPQNQKAMNTGKNRPQSSVQNTQKKNSVIKNIPKVNNSKNVPNSNRQSTTKSNSNNASLRQNASPRKMQVVYRENDKFVSRSLSTMLKQANGPIISTIPNLSRDRPITNSSFRRNTVLQNRYPSSTATVGSKSHSTRPSTQSSNQVRSRSYGKPVNTIHNPLQQTTANYIRSKSYTSNISRNTGSVFKQINVPSGNVMNKKPSLYLSPKELMVKNFRRSNHALRPISMNSNRSGSQNGRNTRSVSLNSKPNQIRNKSPGTQNIPNQNVKRTASPNSSAKNERKPQNQNTKQIEIINRINFQNGKKSIENVKPSHSQAPPEKIKSATLDRKPSEAKTSSTYQSCKSNSATPIKFMKNTENSKPQKIADKTEKPETAKAAKENEDNQGVITEMGDGTIASINDKIQDIIDKIKDEKESNAQIAKLNPVETTSKINSEKCSPQPSKPQTPQHPAVAKSIVPSKPSSPNRPITSSQNINKLKSNNKIYINKGQQSKQNINNQSKKQSSTMFKNQIVKRQSVQSTSVITKNQNNVILNRKLSILTPMEIVQDFVNLVNRAKRDRKTFTVCGNYYSIRRAFAERGWVEKLRINLIDDKESWRRLENLSNYELVEGIKDKENGDKYRRIFISKLLAGHQVDFYWDYMTNPFTVNNDKIKRTLINRFPFGATRSYTSKAGLCESLKEAYWYYIEGYSNILYPRTYNLSYEEEIHSFVEDFRRTAVISLLQWIIKNADTPSSIISPNGQIPTSVFNFATLQCYNLIKSKEHKDIDEIIPMAKEYEWDIFLEKFYKIVHQGNHFKETQNITAPLLIDQARYILNKMKKYVPQMEYDGNMNLWLLKPNNGSRGCGIHVCRTLRYTLDTVHSRKDTKYVIQKYLERPLLIHNTKFDIRQWFLITCMPNLHIWLYKDCYLRFSSQVYDLSKLHESIHLTNNSVQCRYKNSANRSNDLPDQNMWHSDTFRRYLSDIGQPYAWRNIIYKGIKECLIGLFMLCQEKLLTRVNSFELCGADFMLADDYRPYLIEINSRPALYPSTKITAKMCPKVLEDVVKVTIDYARNPRASTGNFELIYKDTCTYIPPKNINSLVIEGISYSKFANDPKKAVQPKTSEKLCINEIDDNAGTIQKILKIDPNKVRKDVKNTLEKILAIIHSEQHKATNDKSSDEKSKQFKMMLSEFVDIISCVKSNAEKIQ